MIFLAFFHPAIIVIIIKIETKTYSFYFFPIIDYSIFPSSCHFLFFRLLPGFFPGNRHPLIAHQIQKQLISRNTQMHIKRLPAPERKRSALAACMPIRILFRSRRDACPDNDTAHPTGHRTQTDILRKDCSRRIRAALRSGMPDSFAVR